MISKCSGLKYYRIYKNDPEKKISIPRNSTSHLSPSTSPPPAPQSEHVNPSTGHEPFIKSVKETWVTEEQIKKLIHCVKNKKMTIHAAASRAKLGPVNAYKYYYRYKEEGKIPKPRSNALYNIATCTHNQIKDLIHYVENEKISINAASAKVKLAPSTSMKYHTEHLKTGRLPTPSGDRDAYCTFEQKRIMIDHLFNDKMTLQEACISASMTIEAGIRYYAKQLVEPDRPVPPELKDFIGPYTHEQIKLLIRYVIDYKMTAEAALDTISTVEGL